MKVITVASILLTSAAARGPSGSPRGESGDIQGRFGRFDGATGNKFGGRFDMKPSESGDIQGRFGRFDGATAKERPFGGRFDMKPSEKKSPLETIEMCQQEIMDVCGLDVSLALETLSGVEEARAAREAGTFDRSTFTRPGEDEETKEYMDAIRECLQTMPEDSVCYKPPKEDGFKGPGKFGGRFGGKPDFAGKPDRSHGPRGLEVITACQGEILSVCDIDVTTVLEELTQLEETKQAARAAIEAGNFDLSEFVKPELAESTKEHLEDIRECLQSLPEEEAACMPERERSGENPAIGRFGQNRPGMSFGTVGKAGAGKAGKGGKGGQPRAGIRIINACRDEILAMCDVDVSPALAEMETFRQAAQSGGRFSSMPSFSEDTKQDLQEIRRCLAEEIPEDSTCLVDTQDRKR